MCIFLGGPVCFFPGQHSNKFSRVLILWLVVCNGKLFSFPFFFGMLFSYDDFFVGRSHPVVIASVSRQQFGASTCDLHRGMIPLNEMVYVVAFPTTVSACQGQCPPCSVKICECSPMSIHFLIHSYART